MATLLSKTEIARQELEPSHWFWVSNDNDAGSDSFPSCHAMDRHGSLSRTTSCNTLLPTLCTNSVPRLTITATNPGDRSKRVRVYSSSGREIYEGFRDQLTFRFYGLRYAKPPVGPLRFQAPRRITPHHQQPPQQQQQQHCERILGTKTIVDATKFGNACIQLPFAGIPASKLFLGAEESEDCLFLNVFTPTLKAKNHRGIPVMVYVHGGSYTSWAASSPLYEAGNLVSRGEVVVVTVNYRLGIFGVFQNSDKILRSEAPGNLALRDQIAALHWVKENIADFGGDPTRVTIFGESAGGYSMRSLISAPASFGLYQNVIIQSDFMGMPFMDKDFADDLATRFLTNLGCNPDDIACARSKNTSELVTAETLAIASMQKSPQYSYAIAEVFIRPVVDGDLIQADLDELIRRGKHNSRVNLMIGSTMDEYGAGVGILMPTPVPVSDAGAAIARFSREKDRIDRLLSSPYYQFDPSIDNDTVRNQFTLAETDFYATCPIQSIGHRLAEYNRVFIFKIGNGGVQFAAGTGDALTPFCEQKVCHGEDILPSFGSLDAVTGIQQTGIYARFSRLVIDRFSTFSKTGDPNPSARKENGSSPSSPLSFASGNPDVTSVHWQPIGAKDASVVVLAVPKSEVLVNKDRERCLWIEKNLQFEYQIYGSSSRSKI
ncbi:hypothetical protein BGZ83_010500 [Gryganskiella cystojenkinii]|nr:hypothetical protein BGZ83_010500 [Gryganskiella cystojenkinii]